MGEWVPMDRLEQLDFEMQEVEQEQGDADSDDSEDLDSGNGMKSVPKDDVDMETDPTESEELEADTKFMVTHPSKEYVPQPEEDDPDKIPPHPEELPENPSLVAWIPDNDCTEVWSTGRALIPVDTNVTWNLQIRADEAIEGSTKMEEQDGEIVEVARTNRHDEWEDMCKHFDCEVIAERQPTDTPPSDSGESEQTSGYQGRQPDESLDGKWGGDNFHI